MLATRACMLLFAPRSALGRSGYEESGKRASNNLCRTVREFISKSMQQSSEFHFLELSSIPNESPGSKFEFSKDQNPNTYEKGTDTFF